MTRDYKNAGKQPAPAKRPTPSKTSTAGGSIWKGMLIGLFFGVAVAVGVALYVNRHNNPFTPVEAKPAASAAASTDKAASPAKPETLKPGAGTKQPPAPEAQRYDFYKILPGNEEPAAIPNPPPTPAPPAPAETKAGSESKPMSAYFQVGSFPNEADADNLKATLALKGIEANIQTTTLPDKGIWHRVRVGPLKSPEDIDKMRRALQQNGITANLIQPRSTASASKPKTEQPSSPKTESQ